METKNRNLKLNFLAIFFLLASIFSIFLIENLKKVEASSTSFYSTKNAPIFYGATEITIDKDVTTNFSVLDSRFRILAKDFEDGDLSFKIKCLSNNVNPTVAGDYQVKYSVQDSHKNVTKITVPVHVLDKTEGECKIIRTVYAIPSMNNLKMVGTERCNTGDRQILGIYLPENSSAQVKVIDAPSNLTFTFFSNIRTQNSYKTLQANTSEYQTIENIKNGASYDCVPLITSPRLTEEVINETCKIELKFNSSVKELDYYHYKDSEEDFKNKWKRSGNTFGVVDGEAIMCVVPFIDVDKLSNYYASGYNDPFESLDAFFEYYLEVVNRMDKMLGLEFDTENPLDQNYRIKYTAVADAGVSAGAYYNGDFIAVCRYTIAPIFQYGWGTLHEIAHGYQGYLGKGANNKGSIYLNETGNNVLAHYIQMDTSLYKKSDRYLGELASAEDRINATRKQKIESNEGIFNNNGGTYTNISEKMFCIINLLDNFEGPTSYGKLFSYFRKIASEQGVNAFSIPEIYAKFFATEYKANIIPYLKAWGMTFSNEVESEILKSGISAYSILSDSVSTEKLNQILTGENLTLKYGLICEEIFEKYSIKGNLKITINIDNFELIKNKPLVLCHRNKVVKVVKIASKVMEFNNLTCGTYEIKLPINFDYQNNLCSVSLTEGENEITYNYVKNSYNFSTHLTSIKINGIYGTNGYTLAFSDDYKTGKVSFGGADLGNRNSTWQEKPDEVFVSVTITNSNDEEIDKVEVKGNQYFINQTLNNPTLNFAVGYKIKIFTHKPNLVGVYSLQTGNKISAYNSTGNNIEYEITENGIKLLGVDNFDEATILYNEDKTKLISLIEEYKNSASTEEIENKRINSLKKSEVICAYESLNDTDKEPYTSFINEIKKGGSPNIEVENVKIKISKGETLDLHSLINITDNEDILIENSEENVVVLTELDINKKGNYVVKYSVKDSDNNESFAEIEVVVNNPLDIILPLTICLILLVAILIFILIKKKKIKKPKAI